MAITPQANQGNVPIDGAAGQLGIELDNYHTVINTLVVVLQRHFKEDTNYLRPLMPPQANMLFMLDREAAQDMAEYMTTKLKEAGDFREGEFCFTRKSGPNGEVLQRLRLDFPDGVSAGVIRKMLIAIDKLERILPAYQS